MTFFLSLALIPATWALAFLLVRPVADRTTGTWTLPILLALGCSGSVVVLVVSQ